MNILGHKNYKQYVDYLIVVDFEIELVGLHRKITLKWEKSQTFEMSGFFYWGQSQLTIQKIGTGRAVKMDDGSVQVTVQPAVIKNTDFCPVFFYSYRNTEMVIRECNILHFVQ